MRLTRRVSPIPRERSCSKATLVLITPSGGIPASVTPRWSGYSKRSAKRRFARGGSTITQQMIKNVLLSKQKTLTRKVREFVLARRAGVVEMLLRSGHDPSGRRVVVLGRNYRSREPILAAAASVIAR